MKYLNKHILIASLLSTFAQGAEKPTAVEAGKPVLKIAAFTMKSQDGTFEMKMEDTGKVFLGGKHIATAHANGEITGPKGEAIARRKENGDVEPANGGVGLNVSDEGTLKGGGELHSWVDGKFQVGPKAPFKIVLKDSPSRPVATLMFLIPQGMLGGGSGIGIKQEQCRNPSLPDARPRSDRPRCGGRKTKLLPVNPFERTTLIV